MLVLVLLSALVWFGVLLVPWRPWSTRERIGAADEAAIPDENDPSVTALIPARDEAVVIERTLAGLGAQPIGLHVVLVDDQSTDGTADIAAKTLEENRLTIVRGEPLPPGWSGKLWALEQGSRHANTAHVLLLDADIELAPGILPALLRKMESSNLDLVSVMAELRMVSFWEKLLVPAFVYFFKLLYPFSLANNPRSRVAAAAGGCILLRADALRQIGGFSAIRGALIDDCTLASRVKDRGGKIWLGLSHDVRSHRPYPDLASLWNMVARNAFTQLRYSIGLLLLTTALMLLVFWVPVAAVFFPLLKIQFIGLAALLAMGVAYIPTLRFHGRSIWWAPALPVIGALYLAMTWSSAFRYWFGKRSEWKGRIYGKEEATVHS